MPTRLTSGEAGAVGARVSPFCCPYCGEEDLRPHVADGAGHGAWECRACLRAFRVTFLGLLAAGGGGHAAAAGAGDDAFGGEREGDDTR